MTAYSEEGVQRSVLHELSDDHNRTALGDHALQVNNIRVVELPHDAGLAEEVSPLLLSVARLQSFYGHKHLPFARELQVAAAHLAKLSCGKKAVVQLRWECYGQVKVSSFCASTCT